MRMFELPRVFAPIFQSPNPGLYEFLQGWAQNNYDKRKSSVYRLARAHQNNGFTTNLRKKSRGSSNENHLQSHIPKIPSKAPHPGINQICSEKNLDCQNSVNKANVPRQDNTPKLQVFFVHFFFFNMYRKKQHYDKATPLDWRTLKIQRVDWAQL